MSKHQTAVDRVRAARERKARTDAAREYARFAALLADAKRIAATTPVDVLEDDASHEGPR